MTSRDLTADFKAELAANGKTPVMFFQGQFADGTLRLWSGIGDITWDGSVWTGAGSLLSVSPISETAEVEATGVTVTLSGIPSENTALVLQNTRQNKAGTVWIGFLDADGAIIADPAIAFSGRLDVAAIEDDGTSIEVSVTYESKLRDLSRPRDFRYTSASQAVLYPGDKGFEYVSDLQDWNGKWGRS